MQEVEMIEHEQLEPPLKTTAEIVAEKNAEIATCKAKISELENKQRQTITELSDSKISLAKIQSILASSQENQKVLQIKLNVATDMYNSLLEKLIEKI